MEYPDRLELRKRTFVILLGLLLISPFFYSLFLYASAHGAAIAESSVYSLNLHRFFSEILREQSLYFAGRYAIFPLNYAPWYAMLYVLEFIFNGAASYLILVSIFYFLGFWFLVRLLLYFVDADIKTASARQAGLAALLSLLYFSSLSIFNYIRSNILFALPYLILPCLVYFALSYRRSGNRLFLFWFFVMSLLIADFNLAHAVLIVLAVNLFLFLDQKRGSPSLRGSFGRFVAINCVLIPSFWILAIVAASNALYEGDLSTFASLSAENMYSNNANYLNIFTQRTDWGLFGSWNGELYYDFSAFYADRRTIIFGILPFVALAYAVSFSRLSGGVKKLAVSLLLCVLVIFQLMLGNNNPVYKFFYEHVIFFQVFRNITKLAPLLYLVVVCAVFVYFSAIASNRRHFAVVTALIVLGLIYNIPHWSYAGYFFRDRAVHAIPEYWLDAARFLDTNVDPASKILVLPAIYISDIFAWDHRSDAPWRDKKTWVQGTLIDALSYLAKRQYVTWTSTMGDFLV